MCLITRQKTALIADEDITVFKVLTENESAVFQLFTYELGVEYTEKPRCTEISKTIHTKAANITRARCFMKSMI